MPTLPFTQTQRQQLIAALLDAFASRDELERLVWTAFDCNPQTLIGERVNLTRAVEEVVDEAASRQGGVRRLLIVATEQRTQHVELAQLSQTWSSITFPVTPRPAQPPSQISEVMRANPGFFFLNVPPMPANFVGRDELVTQLVNQLCSGKSTALSADGLPGVGKTTLAVALARHPQILSHFGDGVLWAGLGQTPDVASIQASWAELLGAEIREILDPYQRMARISNAVWLRKLLIVIDDAWQLEAARQLRCTAPNVVHLLTTRNQELARSFAGARQQLAVPLLASQPSYELLQTLAPEAWASDPAATQALADKVDGLPLALELLGGYLSGSSQRRTAQRRQQALRTLSAPAARLSLATQRLGDSRSQQVSLEQIITLSLEDLQTTTVACFYSLGAFAPKPARFDVSAALAISQVSEEELLALADRSLLEWCEDETLSMHQTLADLARMHMNIMATNRHRDYYLALVNNDQDDWRLIETVHSQICFAWQNVGHHDPISLNFIRNLGSFQIARGLWQDRQVWLKVVLDSALLRQDFKTEAVVWVELGFIQFLTGSTNKAIESTERSLFLSGKVKDRFTQSVSLNNLACFYSSLGDKEKALELLARATFHSSEIRDLVGYARSLSNFGTIYDDSGQKELALALYNQALIYTREAEDKLGTAGLLNNIARLLHNSGNLEAALQNYYEALDLVENLGDIRLQGYVFHNISEVYSSLGDNEQTLYSRKRSLSLHQQVGDRQKEVNELRNIGNLCLKMDNKLEALSYYEQSIPLLKQLNDSINIIASLLIIAEIYMGLNDFKAAQCHFEETLTFQSQIGDKFGELQSRLRLAMLYLDQNNQSKVLVEIDTAIEISNQIELIEVGDLRETLNQMRHILDEKLRKAKDTQDIKS